MIKIRVTGGLGNQLFQYATARSLAEKIETSTTMDISVYKSYNVHPFKLAKFNCKTEFSDKSSLFRKLLEKRFFQKVFMRLGMLGKYYFEDGLFFNKKVLSLQNETKLFGYFQSEKYFINIRQKLLEELTLIDELNDIEQALSEEIKNSNSISIHIRRGDYVSNLSANQIHGTCDSSYFKKSLAYLENKGILIESSHLYLFSDDIDWCRENLNFGYNTTFIEGCSERPEVDMILMSRCQHHIISNSTFSWWGAWLNSNEAKVVIAPIKWFQSAELDSIDIIPESWVKL
ncbi:alpha-1,2-fucosyltransferase [Aliivibrio sifiae]|uniref:alpha-1,2-fucosyltransferase n=1 Tax=Aliivibrio sifiae TaxID=566293 RepID=UPI003D0B2A43